MPSSPSQQHTAGIKQGLGAKGDSWRAHCLPCSQVRIIITVEVSLEIRLFSVGGGGGEVELNRQSSGQSDKKHNQKRA